MKSPVLFLIFKREDTTRQVFERIREVQPPKLYIAADGPRDNKPGEREQCEATRKIVENIDWPCEVHKLFQEKNLGCGKGVSTAISWFFENEPEGIIIEDDILAHPDFFKYCDEMLERFRNDEEIQMICGHNNFYDGYSSSVSYYKSSYPHIWGWATWRRVWLTYEFDVNNVSRAIYRKNLYSRISPKCAAFYLKLYDIMSEFKCDTWDFQFLINMFANNRYSIVSYANQTKNIGMGSIDAAHTTEDDIRISSQAALSSYPIKHPEKICLDVAADYTMMMTEGHYIPNIFVRIKRYIGYILKRAMKLF